MSVRSALVVASHTYEDPKLRALRAPARDAEALARVLGDQKIGGFEVDVSIDEPEHVVRRRLATFFKDRSRDDLLLLHFSCHGLKDEDGQLYFATPDTDLDHLDATALPAEFVNRSMSKSLSRRIVLFLDCCYGGAFAAGARAGGGVDLKERFDGRGRVVLTASTSMEYAYEGDQVLGEGRPSIFTSAVVEGLETGDADHDGDGEVSVDDLYAYVFDRVRSATPNQTPTRFMYDVEGDLVLARSPRGIVVTAVPLPAELVRAIEDRLAGVRAGAVEELRALLRAASPGLALSARAALEQLVDDDSKMVSAAAARALGERPHPQEAAPKVEPQPPPPPRREPKIAAVPPPAAPVPERRSRANVAATILSFAAAAALAVAAARQPGWLLYRPPTLAAGAFAGAALTAARRGGPTFLAVLLLEEAFGAAAQAKIAWGLPRTLLVLAAALLLGAASLQARRIRATAPARPRPPELVAVAAGAAVMFGLAPFVPFRWDERLVALGWMFALESLAFAATAAAAAVLLAGPAVRRSAAPPLLLATGVNSALYIGGVFVHASALHAGVFLVVGAVAASLYGGLRLALGATPETTPALSPH